jgi:thymidine kinase
MKHSRDDRYSQALVSTHDHETRTAISCATLLPHVPACLDYDLVGIDEAQFFPDLVAFAERLTDRGKIVIVAGLDGSFQRKPFGAILDLISQSESVQKLSAVCTVTGTEACFSKRTCDSQELELIGGADLYTALSRSAFIGRATKGEVHMTVGPVKSGKTTELRRLLRRHQIAGQAVVLLCPAAAALVDGIPVLAVEALPEFAAVAEFDAIGVDDAQHFSNIAEWADELANRGKIVNVSALDGDWERAPFRNVIECVSISERLQKLESVCVLTGLPAPFSTLRDGVWVPVSRLALAAPV